MSNNELFKLDVATFKKYNTSKIIELFKNGYEEFVVENVRVLSKAQILRLLSAKDDDIDYIREKILTKNIALLFSDDRLFFETLPDTKKSLIAYYGYNCYEMETFGYDKGKYNANLRLLLTKKFPEFTNELQERILNFYGILSSRTIEFVFINLIADINYLDQIKVVADKYFDSDLKLAIMFHEKYPNLYNKILGASIDITIGLKESLRKLAEDSSLENVDILRLDDLYSLNIDDYNYAVDGNGVASSKVYQGCMDNYMVNTVLFNYPREIVKVDVDSNIEEYDAAVSHLLTLKSIYRCFDTNDSKITEIIYMANLNGDVLFITENAGLVIWLPPTITNDQKEKILSMLNGIPDTNDICISYALLDKKLEFVMLKDGAFFTKEQAIKEISKIKVDDNCSYLEFYGKGNTK